MADISGYAQTELAGMKVNLTVYKGQKVFSITDKEGKVTHLANEQELMMFVADKIATEMKNELHIEKEPQETVAPFAERVLKEPHIGEIL